MNTVKFKEIIENRQKKCHHDIILTNSKKICTKCGKEEKVLSWTEFVHYTNNTETTEQLLSFHNKTERN